MGQWRAGIALVAIGAVWFVVAGVWFARRVRQLRQRENLTSRDAIAIEYPRWMLRVASAYVMVLATSMGLAIVGAVVFVVIALIRN